MDMANLLCYSTHAPDSNHGSALLNEGVDLFRMLPHLLLQCLEKMQLESCRPKDARISEDWQM
jgi:hypothetical protein